MKTISLEKSGFFSEPANLEKLNRFISSRNTLNFMPHELAVATGCAFEDAMEVLTLLYRLDIAKQFLLVYHIAEPDYVIEQRDIAQGPPDLPMIILNSNFNEVEVTDSRELLYSFLFKLNDKVEFSGDL